MSARFTVLALAQPRSGWFREVARWASSAALPIEMVVGVTGAEVHARLASGRAWSALLADEGHPGLDTDLIALAAGQGCATVVVGEGRAHRDWLAVGAAAALPSLFDRSSLLAVLEAHATPVDDLRGVSAGDQDADPEPGGRLVAVLGPGGSGTSTTARAVAQGLGQRRDANVVLADLALDADQALAHHTGDVVPGLPELLDAHRRGALDALTVRSLTFGADHLPYQLLLGLRRHRDWTTLRRRSTEAALAALRGAFDVVVADVDGDLEGETETGSADVADRNLLARTAVRHADLVLVVLTADLRSLHRWGRLLPDVAAAGGAPGRVQPVVVGAPRRPARRAELVATLHRLAELETGTTLPPLFLPWRSEVARAVRDGAALPRALADAAGRSVAAALHAQTDQRPPAAEPEPVRPGELGRWFDEVPT